MSDTSQQQTIQVFMWSKFSNFGNTFRLMYAAKGQVGVEKALAGRAPAGKNYAEWKLWVREFIHC